MIAPDHVPDICDPKMADWSSKVRGETVLQPSSDRKIGTGYPFAYCWRRLYPEIVYDDWEPHHSYEFKE